MVADRLQTIRFRPFQLEDLGRVPTDCQGSLADVEARIHDLGAAAILAFDGEQHVGQLQFRRHRPGLRSAAGIFSPDYWGDFGGRLPPLPHETLCLYCFHVGQLSDGKDRDPGYQGRGLGAALLDQLIGWATAHGFAGLLAKSMPPAPEIMGFMGGQPEQVYEARGFTCVDRWVDRDMHAGLVERGVVPADSDPADVARVGLWVRELHPSA